MINRKSHPLPRSKSPIEKLVEDSYDEVMDEAYEEEYAPAPSSFRSRETAKTKKVPKRFIIRATVVDKFTIIRKRVQMTPSMCDVHGCNFDIAEKNHFGSWRGVPHWERKRLLEALEEHKQIAHNNSENYIITEDQMPTRWLGSERGLKEL